MSAKSDVLIVGAGPAGLAAAVSLRDAGLAVSVFDEQPAAGGQVWRAVEANGTGAVSQALGDDYRAGGELVARFHASGAAFHPLTQVWQIEPDWRVFLTEGGRAGQVESSAILLATGAQERAMPFSGWTLPGVVTVGGAQILLKTSGQVPDQPVWIAGSGPLPLLYMAQLLALGGRIAGYLDTTPRGGLMRALPHLGGALRGRRDVSKGLRWLATLRRAGVPVHRDIGVLEAVGGDRLEAIRYARRGGEPVTVKAGLLLVHEGVVPSIHMTMALGCAHDWRVEQACFAPTVDEWGETSRAGIFVAGDGAGIGGVKAACLRGEIAALGLARRLGRLGEAEAARSAAPLRAALGQALAPRAFLDALYPPRPEIARPADETIVCRCEEVTAAQIRQAARSGRGGPNQVKADTRSGMGPCQGRQCGYTVAHLLAEEYGTDVQSVGFFRIRPPLKPVTLGELASLDVSEPAA